MHFVPYSAAGAIEMCTTAGAAVLSAHSPSSRRSVALLLVVLCACAAPSAAVCSPHKLEEVFSGESRLCASVWSGGVTTGVMHLSHVFAPAAPDCTTVLFRPFNGEKMLMDVVGTEDGTTPDKGRLYPRGQADSFLLPLQPVLGGAADATQQSAGPADDVYLDMDVRVVLGSR